MKHDFECFCHIDIFRLMAVEWKIQNCAYVNSLCIWCAHYTQYVHCTVIPINVQRLFSPFMIKQSLCQTTIIVWDVAHKIYFHNCASKLLKKTSKRLFRTKISNSYVGHFYHRCATRQSRCIIFLGKRRCTFMGIAVHEWKQPSAKSSRMIFVVTRFFLHPSLKVKFILQRLNHFGLHNYKWII